MRFNPLDKRSALLGFLLLGSIAFGLSGTPTSPYAHGVAPADDLTIGPGKVSFQMTREGGWSSITPAWLSRSLISSGGVFVLAGEGDGIREIASSRAGFERAKGAPPTGYHEGVKGGFRAPSVDADDDRDGRIDEDRLDGVDNDGDGAVDEDFAAVGDQMVVTEYRTPVNSGPSLLGQMSPTALTFHQEVYAWSLPHINGTVMINLWVRNAGFETINNVHIGVYFEKAAPFSYAERPTRHLIAGTEPVESRSIIATSRPIDGSSSVALMGFADDGVWRGGYVPDYDDILSAARAQQAYVEVDGGLQPVTAPVEDDVPGEDNVFVYAIAPPVESIDPGEEVLVQFAIVVTPRSVDVDEALTVAQKTYAGDGRYQFLPPPVSMTPRVLWGTYYPVNGDAPGVAINFDALGDDPVSTEQVSYLSGVSSSMVDRGELRPGQNQLVLRGEAAEKILEKNDRVKLKGRLESGEFFEVNLRPDDGTSERAASGPTEDAELFWKIPGKLEDVLDDRVELLRNTPNPFRESTMIQYEVPALIEQESGATLRTSGALDISVKIYDVRGRLVSTLVEEQAPPGVFSVGWSAVDDLGNPVPSGVYFIKLQIGQKFITKRATVVR